MKCDFCGTEVKEIAHTHIMGYRCPWCKAELAWKIGNADKEVIKAPDMNKVREAKNPT